LVPIRVRTPLGPAILIEELGDARFGNSQKLGAETSRLRAKRGRFRIQFFRNRFPESGALIGGSRSANSQKIARGIPQIKGERRTIPDPILSKSIPGIWGSDWWIPLREFAKSCTRNSRKFTAKRGRFRIQFFREFGFQIADASSGFSSFLEIGSFRIFEGSPRVFYGFEDF